MYTCIYMAYGADQLTRSFITQLSAIATPVPMPTSAGLPMRFPEAAEEVVVSPVSEEVWRRGQCHYQTQVI